MIIDNIEPTSLKITPASECILLAWGIGCLEGKRLSRPGQKCSQRVGLCSIWQSHRRPGLFHAKVLNARMLNLSGLTCARLCCRRVGSGLRVIHCLCLSSLRWGRRRKTLHRDRAVDLNKKAFAKRFHEVQRHLRIGHLREDVGFRPSQLGSA